MCSLSLSSIEWTVVISLRAHTFQDLKLNGLLFNINQGIPVIDFRPRFRDQLLLLDHNICPSLESMSEVSDAQLLWLSFRTKEL